jgi:hypothetical protein
MAEENTTPAVPTAQEAQPAKAPAAKKPKEPTIEDKPFGEFIEQHFLPALDSALKKLGVADLAISFQNTKLPLVGATGEPCPQVAGSWQDNTRQFTIYFLDADINGKKAFSYGENQNPPSTIESFMIDERKASLDLLLFYTLQRLNGQKWLTRN